MALPINPYIAGNPVGGSPAFIGRADVLREVLRMTLSVAVGVAGSLAGVVEKSLKNGQPSWLARGTFVALALSHAFLIWFSFLGGWRVFAS